MTVYASLNPIKFQDNDPKTNPNNVVCGTVGQYGVNQGCKSFMTLPDKKRHLRRRHSGWASQSVASRRTIRQPADVVGSDQNVKKNCSGNCEEASPQMISAGKTTDGKSSNSDFVFYKFTIRNPTVPYRQSGRVESHGVGCEDTGGRGTFPTQMVSTSTQAMSPFTIQLSPTVIRR